MPTHHTKNLALEKNNVIAVFNEKKNISVRLQHNILYISEGKWRNNLMKNIYAKNEGRKIHQNKYNVFHNYPFF